ncbi:hypothetical protein M441DRAFT_233590 [Trichoderma asperellum CBS 433.97]|uniref:Uncharacterized protein n=1 Tax=Trichoderma asperellum (strain ATCC 204424 / CBS 433.97 / NBRC 101777) TaxID=1042311 RepID=A0A2T3ZQZ5_TRIA4|nr:hypothetical protein M441DRAFT_233590 [Trichoderma asperellum CBS 433.97]PTB47214.1 hypothetical protein M441DRAFT_233590 [Trichoderma asperellum CBS 433.97]
MVLLLMHTLLYFSTFSTYIHLQFAFLNLWILREMPHTAWLIWNTSDLVVIVSTCSIHATVRRIYSIYPAEDDGY